MRSGISKASFWQFTNDLSLIQSSQLKTCCCSMFLWVFFKTIMGFSSSPQTVIVHREVVGPSELISKKESFKREGITLTKCDVLKTCFDKVEGDVWDHRMMTSSMTRIRIKKIQIREN
jgi:hypothetical protein